MSDKAKQAVAIFQQHVDSSDGHGEWLTVDQARINLFADATLDHQFIHIDPEKSAKLSPYKVTIAHGFLTLSLIPHLTSSIAARDARAYDGLVMGVHAQERLAEVVSTKCVFRHRCQSIRNCAPSALC